MRPDFFFGEVVNVKDDVEMVGRMLVRVHGDQNDTSRIPDEKLRWARPITNSHDAPQYGGVGRGGTAMVPGTQVFGFYADSDKQHPFILGAIPIAGKTENGKIEQTGTMPDGTTFSAGVPFGNEGPLNFQRPRYQLDGDATKRIDIKGPSQQLLKSLTLEAFFGGNSGNGPPRYANETNILASILPSGIISDMTSFVRSINPSNIGGLPATLNSVLSLANQIRGLPNQILGEVSHALLGTFSSIINMGASNIVSAIGDISTGLSTAMEIGSIGMEVLAPIAALPLSSVQQIGLNLAAGGIRNNDIGALVNLANNIDDISPETSSSQYTQIATSVSNISGSGPTTTLVLENIAKVSDVSNQIAFIASTSGIMEGVENPNTASIEKREAIAQLTSLARQSGELLGVGDRLVVYANKPAILLENIDYLIKNMR